MASKGMSPAYMANQLWNKTPKANAELFSLTYGALVAELLRDLESGQKVNEQLDQMGYSMVSSVSLVVTNILSLSYDSFQGIRCIEEFLSSVEQQQPAHAPSFPTTKFTDCPDILKMAFKMFLNVAADINSGDKSSKFVLSFADNPLAHFVELPTDDSSLAELEYCQLLCGYCRGMLSALQFDVSCSLTQSILRGDGTNQLTVTLNQVMSSGAGEEYHEE